MLGFQTYHNNMKLISQKPQHIGFSSKNRCKKRVDQNTLTNSSFTLVDSECVIDDLVNRFNIPFGQVPGDPAVGTNLWDYIFDPNSEETRLKIDTEVKRVISLDPRITVGSIKLFSSEHGVYVKLEIAIKPTNLVSEVSILFDIASNNAILTT